MLSPAIDWSLLIANHAMKSYEEEESTASRGGAGQAEKGQFVLFFRYLRLLLVGFSPIFPQHGLTEENEIDKGNMEDFLRNNFIHSKPAGASQFLASICSGRNFVSPRLAPAGRGEFLLSPALSSTSLWRRGRNPSCSKTGMRLRPVQRADFSGKERIFLLCFRRSSAIFGGHYAL
jgi:hypothetical protein